jgi:hypothetical protein
VVAALPLAVPWWRVRAVDVSGFDNLPGSVVASLGDLVGRCPLTLDPQWVRRQVEVWPEVAAVDVKLELPATLRVHATPTLPTASLPVGRRWRAVTEDGLPAGPLDEPRNPVLIGFGMQPDKLRRAMRVARRLANATGGDVEEVRFVTPADFAVRLRPLDGRQTVTLRVRPTRTHAERYWCERVADTGWVGGWADLRGDDRVVIGGDR